MLWLARQIVFQQRFQCDQPFKQIVMLRGVNRRGDSGRSGCHQPRAFTQPLKHRFCIVPFAQRTVLYQPETVAALAN